MAYPIKPSGNYAIRNYDFAQSDTKKIPMSEALFKNGYKNADESEIESVPDAHEQNWLFDILHRNVRYAIEMAEENKYQIDTKRATTSDLGQVQIGVGLDVTENGVLSVNEDIRGKVATIPKLRTDLDSNISLSNSNKYELDTKVATPTSIGQIKVGYGLEISNTGVLSVAKQIAENVNIVSYDLPVGSYMMWAGNNTPDYFIEPAGQTLLRSSYPELWRFAQENGLVGKLFGAGDGSTTFTVTDIRGHLISIVNSNDKIGIYTPDTLLNIQNGFDITEGGANNVIRQSNWGLKLILKALPTPPEFAVPVGTILDYSANTVPVGYLKANGATISRTTFSRLWQWANTNGMVIAQSSKPNSANGYYGTGNGSTTFTIPDLRGVFKRGVDDGSGRGGHGMGSFQDQGLPDHNHNVDIGLAVQPFNASAPLGGGNLVAGVSNVRGTDWASAHNGVYGVGEVRTRNVSVNYIIKY